MRIGDAEKRVEEIERGFIDKKLPLSELKNTIKELDEIFKSSGNKTAILLKIIIEGTFDYEVNNQRERLIGGMQTLEYCKELNQLYLSFYGYIRLGIRYLTYLHAGCRTFKRAGGIKGDL